MCNICTVALKNNYNFIFKYQQLCVKSSPRSSSLSIFLSESAFLVLYS
jgi:hypothetical protein